MSTASSTDLAEAQRQLYAKLRDRSGPPTDDPTASDEQRRLNVYRRAYFARLYACLQDDFARVEAAAGTELFETIASEYIEARPPRDAALRDLGRDLPAFLAERWPERRDLYDLARLEWAWVEVFDAANDRPLDRCALASVAPTDWPQLVFRPIRALRVIDTAYPVHRVADAPDTPLGGPASTTVLVWRRNLRVFVRAQPAAEATAWRAVVAGAPFERWCALVDYEDIATAAARAIEMLTTWLDEGLLWTFAAGHQGEKQNG